MNQDNTAVVFDIKRFAVHDGPGIRTSLFLKGCPLNCKWCHNPEGIAPEPQLWYFPNQCLGCGDCIKECSDDFLSFNEKGKIAIDYERCENWERCVNVCPTRALVTIGERKTLDELESELLKDVAFYKESSGGITLTGGEPLAQSKIAIALLKRMKNCGIHTAVETSLHVPTAVLGKVIPLTDLFLTDLKVFDYNLHKDHTGQGNDLILSNMKTLFKTEKPMVIRIPLIPGFTDATENLKNIANFVSQAGRPIPVELMNFNPLARDKFDILGRPYVPEGVTEPYGDDAMNAFRQIFADFGLEVK